MRWRWLGIGAPLLALAGWQLPYIVSEWLVWTAHRHGLLLTCDASFWEGGALTLQGLDLPAGTLGTVRFRPRWDWRCWCSVEVEDWSWEISQQGSADSFQWPKHLWGSWAVAIAEGELRLPASEGLAWRTQGNLFMKGPHLHLDVQGRAPSNEWALSLERSHAGEWSGDCTFERLPVSVCSQWLRAASEEAVGSALELQTGLLSGKLLLHGQSAYGDLLLSGMRVWSPSLGLELGLEDGLLSLDGPHGALLTISEPGWIRWGAVGLTGLRGSVLWQDRLHLDLHGAVEGNTAKRVHLTSTTEGGEVRARIELLKIPMRPAIAELVFHTPAEGIRTELTLQNFGRPECAVLAALVNEHLLPDAQLPTWTAQSLNAEVTMRWQDGALCHYTLEELDAEGVEVEAAGLGVLTADALHLTLEGPCGNHPEEAALCASGVAWTLSSSSPYLTEGVLHLGLSPQSGWTGTLQGSLMGGACSVELSEAMQLHADWSMTGEDLRERYPGFTPAALQGCEAHVTLSDHLLTLDARTSWQGGVLPLHATASLPAEQWWQMLPRLSLGQLPRDLQVRIHQIEWRPQEAASALRLRCTGYYEQAGDEAHWGVDLQEAATLLWGQQASVAPHQTAHLVGWRDPAGGWIQLNLPICLGGELAQRYTGEVRWDGEGLLGHWSTGSDPKALQWSWNRATAQGALWTGEEATPPPTALPFHAQCTEQELHFELPRGALPGLAEVAARSSWNLRDASGVGDLYLRVDAPRLAQHLCGAAPDWSSVCQLLPSDSELELQGHWQPLSPMRWDVALRQEEAQLWGMELYALPTGWECRSGSLGPFALSGRALEEGGQLHLQVAEAHLRNGASVGVHDTPSGRQAIHIAREAWVPLLEQLAPIWAEVETLRTWITPQGDLHALTEPTAHGWRAACAQWRGFFGALPLSVANLTVEKDGERWILEGLLRQPHSAKPFQVLSHASTEGAGAATWSAGKERCDLAWVEEPSGWQPVLMRGTFCGQRCDLLLAPDDSGKMEGELTLELEALCELLPERIGRAFSHLGINGQLFFRGTIELQGEDLRLHGKLYGHDTHLFHIEWSQVTADLDADSEQCIISNLRCEDEAGSLIAPLIAMRRSETEGWRLQLPYLEASGLIASQLRWPGASSRSVRDLQVELFTLERLEGPLAQPDAWTGGGRLRFENEAPRPFFLTVPGEILGNLGLDPALLEPVRGTLHFSFEEGWIRIKELENVVSRKKRSLFYLHGDPGFSLIGWDGSIHLRLRMKQNVLFRLTEPLNLYITGSLWNPEVSFQHSEHRIAPFVGEAARFDGNASL